MPMVKFNSFSGTITSIEDFLIGNPQDEGCYKLMNVQNNDGNIVNFVIEPDTYFVDNYIMQVGDSVEGYYDANAIVPMIYPPQYRALIVVLLDDYMNVKVDYFDNQLLSSDKMLKLNLSPFTDMVLKSGQPFTANPANRNLIVIYDFTTKSIPAITTPKTIIVLCN
jgi:hypothetical protein